MLKRWTGFGIEGMFRSWGQVLNMAETPSAAARQNRAEVLHFWRAGGASQGRTLGTQRLPAAWVALPCPRRAEALAPAG